VNELQFRSRDTVRELARRLAQVVEESDRKPIAVMHVCGSHEQAIARFGLRSVFPPDLDVIMGPGCPVCVTDLPEVDEAVVLARDGVHVASYGDMLRVPGSVQSLTDAQSDGAKIHVVYSPQQAVELARSMPGEEVVFFASGFETTAVATAAVVVEKNLPKNFSVLSAHKFIPPVMEIVAEMPQTRVEGFLAAGHAAAITGWGIFEEFVERHKLPVVVAGFEPADILAGLVELTLLARNRTPKVVNMFPRCVTREGNIPAQKELWRVFRTIGGQWRGIAHVPNGNLRLRDEWAHVDARKRFTIDLTALWDYAPPRLAADCICGDIMSGIATPADCTLFNKECVPDSPVGACMVSTEGTCRIWQQYPGTAGVSPAMLSVRAEERR
jgi:hydrogenase expression/formation protein HypD